MNFYSVKSPPNVHQLPQGLTLIHQNLPGAGVVVAQVWVNVGSNDQKQDHSGLAHLIEHLIFKGSKRILPGQFDRLIEGLGGQTKAATSYDYTHFSLTLNPANFEQGFAAFAEIITTPAFPPWHVDQERAIVLEEVYSFESDPDLIVDQTIACSLFHNHDYGRSLLGTTKHVKELELETIRKFHHSHYQPENLTIIMVGSLGLEEAIALGKKHFTNYSPRHNYPSCAVPPQPQPYQYHRQRLTYPHLTETRLAWAWHCPGIANFGAICGLDLIAIVLTGHSSGMLIKALADHPLIWDVASAMVVRKQASVFSIKVWLDSCQIQIVETLILQCLEHLAQNLIGAQELAKAKKILINDYIFATETPGQLAELYGSYGTMADISLAQAYPQVIQNFTPKQIRVVSAQYLRGDRCTITVMENRTMDQNPLM